MQYPVRLRLVGQTTSKPEQPFVFEITIQRVDPRQKPVGMEIRQMISRNAPATSEAPAMKLRYLMTTLLLCGPALAVAADNTGWQNAGTPAQQVQLQPSKVLNHIQRTYPQPGLVGSYRHRDKAHRW